MAKINEEIISITISTISRNDEQIGSQLADIPDLEATIEGVIKELVGQHVVVEVRIANQL